MAQSAPAGQAPAGQVGTPPVRFGPRPLALHLASAMVGLAGGVAVLPLARQGLLPWSEDLRARAEEILGAFGDLPLDDLMARVGIEAGSRLEAMLRGIAAYHAHPYRRAAAPLPVVWAEGASRLLDYGADGGVPVVFIPSLVNRGHVLDLMPGASMMRWLARRGLRPLLLEWGAPGEAERVWSIDDYVSGRLERMLDAVVDLAGGPVGVAGYCMGGDLALALALRRQDDVAALALLATPWDFHAAGPEQARLFAAWGMSLEPVLRAFGELPVDVLQTFFLALDPTLALRKFLAFERLDPASAAATQFVALEDWLNDGVPLAAEVARTCLVRWYGFNDPGAGTWQVDGQAVDPAGFRRPALAAIPAGDRIVPPGSARVLAARLPDCHVLTPAAGHIGMVVGRRAEKGLWTPLAEWFMHNVEAS